MVSLKSIFIGTKDVVGLDIGTNYVKLLELEESKGGFRMKNFGMAALPKDTVVNGSILNHDAMVNTISQIISNLKIKSKNTVVSVSGHPVIIKKITMPLTTDDELEASIKFEAEQYIPFDLEEVNVDFQVLDVTDEKADQMNVMLVAAKKAMIDEYTRVLSDAGMKPVILDVDVFALENAFGVSYQIEEDKSVALVDIGASTININIIRGGTSAFTRDIFLGGNYITEEIQKQLGISFEEAEALKTGRGIEGAVQGESEDIIRKGCDNIASEIHKTLDFFSSTAYENIDKLYLSGGCVKITTLKDIIEEKTSVSTEIIDCFKNIKYDEGEFDAEYIQDISPHASVVVGLALRRLGD
jgi:type IV pilus assembly protein PilM